MLPHGLPPRRVAALVVSIVSAAAVLSGLTAVPAAAAVDVPVTYEGHTYPAPVDKPSADKPQSKLWHHDGSWWALLASASDGLPRIHELMPDHTWRNTGTLVDDRVNSTGDALWSAEDGSLYVASRHASTAVRVARFAYSAGPRTWSLASGFPVTVATGGGSESASIDRDTTGRLWLTYTRASRIWVAHSAPGGLGWTAGYNPQVPDITIKSDDISAITSYRGHIGVMWSDQQSAAFRFALHRDGDPDDVWRSEVALSGPSLADDHLNLKQLASDPQGRLFAAIKTSQDDLGPGGTLVGVLVRTPRADGTGDWSLVPAGTVADDHTRPIIMIDATNQELYFFATAPGNGGDIWYKKTSLANPSFGPGRGARFVDTSRSLNDASGAKDPVTASTGMVVLAIANGVRRYAHAEMELASGPPAPDTSGPSVPAGVTATASAGRVDLAWNAATDDIGVAGYTVRRDGSVLVAATTARTYADTAVTPGTTYSYTVQAFDAAGNRSAESAARSVTVPDDPPPGGGEVTLRGVTTATNGAASTIVVPVPAARAAGDLLLASVDVRGKPTITPPSGWTLVRTDDASSTRKATYWKVASAAEPASATWSFSTSVAAVASMSAYDGVSTTAPVDASGGQAAENVTVITPPSVTTTAPDALVVGLFAVAKPATFEPPAGMVERSEVRTPTSAPYQVAAETADAVQASPGPTGARSATSSVKGPGIGQVVVLRPGG